MSEASTDQIEPDAARFSVPAQGSGLAQSGQDRELDRQENSPWREVMRTVASAITVAGSAA